MPTTALVVVFYSVQVFAAVFKASNATTAGSFASVGIIANYVAILGRHFIPYNDDAAAS